MAHPTTKFVEEFTFPCASKTLCHAARIIFSPHLIFFNRIKFLLISNVISLWVCSIKTIRE